MKTTILLAPLIFTIMSSSTTIEKKETPLNISGSEVLEKCIKHYDPSGSWDSFSGKVNIVTTYSGYGEEILEINNATGFYQSTRLNTEEKIIRGMKDGECIRMIGNNSDLTDKQIQDNYLSCENIAEMKEHHTCHFGFLMNMKKVGLNISDDVTEEKFNGWDCYVISYQGNDDVIHNYYLGNGKLFVDKNDYTLRGRVNKHPDFPKRKIINNGELKVNDIIMPAVVIYYAGDDTQIAFVDIFQAVKN